MSYRLMPTLALLLAMPPIGACAISDEPAISDDDEGFEGGDGVGGVQSEGDADEILTVACGDATGEPTFRFSTIKIIEPASLGGLLGGLMKTDIEEGILNILVELRGMTADNEAFSVLGGGGALCEGADNVYTWDLVTPDAKPSDAFAANLDGGTFAIGDDDAVLYFPITLLNASVRLDRLRVSGTLNAARDTITLGQLSGYITKSTAEVIHFPESLGIQGTLDEAMPVNAVEDCGGEECWKLSAEYEAALTTQHAAP